MSHRYEIQIQKASDTYWDFEVHSKVDCDCWCSITGFVKQHENDVEFLLDNQASYHQKSMVEMFEFIQSGRW
jgi:hypothetical protein